MHPRQIGYRISSMQLKTTAFSAGISIRRRQFSIASLSRPPLSSRGWDPAARQNGQPGGASADQDQRQDHIALESRMLQYHSQQLTGPIFIINWQQPAKWNTQLHQDQHPQNPTNQHPNSTSDEHAAEPILWPNFTE
ncbi:hypothetical protein Nepgr_004018 [Nepenthes gracilis]|uniref:Uncharacterized protein n=1 Tax=Nepenthes gracilis TaxID=150966 RepID=A0AAD3S0N8_NEPGR|nr:hypothetical protein Nepgr_004018 [Nepenthes gracilis]